MSYLPNAAVVWRGPSLLTGAPTVVVVTGTNRPIPCVWILGPWMRSMPVQALAESVESGQYEHRAPFPLPGYLIAHGDRAAVPDEVWAALEGEA